jgi:YD repeat-containing protein
VSTQYAGTSLVYNSSLDAFIETFPDGKKMVYDKNQGGSPVRYQIGRVEDASGNRHTFTYGTSPETNLLKNIEVPGGRKVTFAYTAGGSPTSLLDHIEDWGGRRWTMMYDGSRQLTTLTTPLGCTTKNSYTSWHQPCPLRSQKPCLSRNAPLRLRSPNVGRSQEGQVHLLSLHGHARVRAPIRPRRGF